MCASRRFKTQSGGKSAERVTKGGPLTFSFLGQASKVLPFVVVQAYVSERAI